MKARKFFALLLSVIMVLSMMPMTVFAEDNAHAAHSDYVTHIEAVEGNCTTPGNIEFWYCDYYTCEKCYADEAMTKEISPADVVITPGVHSDACVGCEHAKSEKTFELFIPSEHPYYDEDEYMNSGLHMLTPQLKGYTFLFVGEYNGVLYAMGNETLADGSRQAINLSEFARDDGSITVDSDTVEFFTYKEIPGTYTFSPDNGYMTIVDEKIVVHGENLCDIDPSYDIFPQSIRFEQNKELGDYAVDKGYLFGWALNSPLILFDDSGDEPKFAPALMWPEDENGDYIRDESGEAIDNRAHNIMLYMERCEHPNMKHTEAAEASCTQDGAIEHWYCEDCNLYFADAEGKTYIELPEGESDYENYLHTSAWGHSYDDDCICENCGNPCPHTNASYIEQKELESSCFEPGMSGCWFCEDCWRYLDKDQDNAYWDEALASRIPATGHAFNTDTGKCDYCGLANPVYTKVTSLDDVNEEDMYIFVAKVGDKYFVLGGLDENNADERGTVWCGPNGNAIEIVPNEDGSISLLNQSYVDNALPSEFMIDIDPEHFNSDLDDNFGLTPIMLKLPNYCVYPFQSHSLDDTGYMGTPRYANGVYGMWDASGWIIDFYTTEVDENTYRDDMDGYTHAEQVGRGNIGENISEGDLIMYSESMYAVGGAMFTLRFREYSNPNTGVIEYYFIAGEDWALEGSPGWDYVTDTTPTNDTQYAISLYRYDVPTVNTHTCDFGDWTDDGNGKTHTRRCTDEDCKEEQTEEHNWDDGIVTDPPSCTETGVRTFTCSDCKATRTEDIPNCDHAYVWMEGKTSTCIEEGIVPHYHCEDCGKNFDENKGEIDSVELPIGSHEYGPMYRGKSANFWEDGNIEYYQCFECEKYFDGEYNEIETPVIPRYSTNLSICVNGTPTALVLGEQRENFIEWSLEGLSVTKGDVITICQTDNPEIRHQYFADGNVGTDGKILTTAAAANVALTATPNGLMLFIDGYKYEGIVIEINGVQYPMIYTSYPDETTTYIYGYVNFAVGDKFVIVDNVSGTVYDYDDLDPSFAWDAWDFHRGDNGEFVIDYACRYGIEFDYGGNKKIYINKTFAPLDGGSYGLAIENADLVALEQMQIPSNSEGYDEFMWYIAHEDVVNNEDIVSYVGEKGLYVYIVKMQLEEGTRFNIKNLTANSAVNAEHLVEVYTESGSITKDGDYVRILKSGYYSIVYLPCCNGFMIEETKQPADLYMYLDGEFIPLVKGDGNIVTYEGLVADTSTNVMFTDNTYTTYLPIALDSQTNASIAHVFKYNGMSMLYFDKAGTYNLAYNVETGVLSITSVGGDGGEDTEFDPSKYLYYLSVSGGIGSTQTIVMQAGDSNEFCAKNVTLTESCFIGVIEITKDGSTSTTYGAVADTDTSIAQSYGTVAMVKIAGTYDVYFNTDAKTIKLVAVTSGSTEEKAMPKDIYIRYDNILILSESPENADELCYLGLEMGAWDEFQIRDTDKNYIADITLAEGTTGVVTNGTKITFQVGGTFDIYINKTTHEIRIVAAHECTWSDWSSNGDGTHTRTCRCNAHEIEDCEWDDGVVDVPPTHTKLGKMLYTCTVCKATKTEDIPVLTDHAWGEWMINELDNDTHIRFCICNETQTAPHNFDDGVVTEPATHTSKGVKTFTCEDCGYFYTEDIPKSADHEWSDWYTNQNGTHSRSCACNEVETEDCKWDDGVVDVPPTHTKPGTILYTCTVCQATKTEDIPVLTDHTWGEWVINKLDNDTHIRFCICNESQTAPHNFDGGVVTEPATHTSKGVMTYTCEDCGYFYTEDIPKSADHEWSDWHTNQNGTHSRSCACNEVETEDCKWDDGVLDVPPTHTKLGTMLYTCTVCKATKTEDIPVLTGHTWGEWVINKLDNDTHIHFCICGASETAPHNFDDGVVTEPATHTSKGVKTFTCGDCGYTYDEEISTTPDHEWSEWDPGETADLHTRFCECGESESAAHEFGDEETVLQPTDNSIHLRSVCSVCGYEKDTVATGTVVTFTNCEGLNVNPLIFVQNGDETAFTLKLPTAADVAEREGYKLVGWTASIDGINYSSGAELFIAYADASAITFSAEWAMVVGEGEQKLAANEAYITDMDAFEIKGEGITYQGDQVFYVPKDGIYALIESKNDEEVE